jgi:hypothetical protein
MKNAVFTGEKMSEALNVKYRRIDWNVDPPKKYQLYCLSEWEENISKLSDEIVKIVH